MVNYFVKVDHLTKHLGHKKVLEDVSFQIKNKSIVGFLGPNGAGKTTTLKHLVKLYKPDSGQINFVTSPSAKKQVGAIIETPAFYESLSGLDNLKIFARMSGKVDHHHLKQLVGLVDLNEVMGKKVKTYSLGMKQRLGIAQALYKSPQLLVLDEPFNGLDPHGIEKIILILKDIVKESEISVLISSHNLYDLSKFCNEVIIINKGTIVETVNLDQKQTMNLEELYFSVIGGEGHAIS